jgi:hypothetical protein
MLLHGTKVLKINTAVQLHTYNYVECLLQHITIYKASNVDWSPFVSVKELLAL